MFKILEFRNQYRSCHIRLPDDDQRVAAVMVDGKFYSLLKIVRDREKALKICDLLVAKGGEVVLTKTAKGDAIWLWEADAIVEPPPQKQLKPEANVGVKLVEAPPCKILESPNQYQQCHIRIPDMNERLEAIYVGGKYYGLFKAGQTPQQALELVTKLQQRGDTAIITRLPKGDTVWVLESDAFLA